MPKISKSTQSHEKHRERLRSRFLSEGLNGFQDHEVLELLLFYAIPRVNTNETAHRLIRHFGSLASVLEASYEELLGVEGVGPASASLIRLSDTLCVRRRKSAGGKTVYLKTSDKAGEYFLSRLYQNNTETFMIVCLDARRRVRHEQIVGTGDAWHTGAQPSYVAEIALRHKAVSLIMAHNHPSGLTNPSPEDLAFTLRIRAALAALEIELTDHIIVADDDYYSLSAAGLI